MNNSNIYSLKIQYKLYCNLELVMEINIIVKNQLLPTFSIEIFNRFLIFYKYIT